LVGVQHVVHQLIAGRDFQQAVHIPVVAEILGYFHAPAKNQFWFGEILVGRVKNGGCFKVGIHPQGDADAAHKGHQANVAEGFSPSVNRAQNAEEIVVVAHIKIKNKWRGGQF